MSSKILLRRGTAAEWSSANPILGNGELGIETDTLKIKIGNGSSTWSQLSSYANVTPAQLTSQINSLISAAPSTLDTLNELAAAINNDASFSTTVNNLLTGKVSKSGGDTITASTASTVGVVVKGAASQTANLQQWQTSTGFTLAKIDANGNFTFNTAANVINGALAAYTPLTIKGAASQTANLQEWQDSAGTMLANVSSSGQFLTPRLTITNGGNIVDSAGTTPYFGFGSNQIAIYTRNAAYKGLIIQGSASQTANLQEWQDSAGTVITRVGPSGVIETTVQLSARSALTAGTNNYLSASLSVIPLNASVVGQVIRGAASQTADLQQWQNSAGTVLANISASGVITSTAKIMYLDNGALRFGYGGGNIGSNLAIGNTALNNNTTGTDNFALGSYSMYNTTTGGYNVAVGTGTLYWNVVGAGNTAIGSSALNNNTSSDNTAIGIMALVNSTSGYGNSGLGSGTLTSNTTANYNTAVGRSAGTMFTTGGNNTVVGAISFYHSSTTSTGVNNTALGYGAGAGNTGSSNLFLGYSAGSQETGSNKLYIANSNTTTPLIGGDFSAKTLTVAGNASIISQATGTVGLIVKGLASQTANLQEWQNSAGTVLASISANGGLFIKPTSTSGNLLKFENTGNTFGWSVPANEANAIVFDVNRDPRIYWGSNMIWTMESTPNSSVIRPYTSDRYAMTVRGLASQTGDLQQWQNSTGTVLAKVDKDGNFSNVAAFASISATSVSAIGGNITTTYGLYSNLPASTNAGIAVLPWAANIPGAIIRGFASQTANLQEWQNSSGTVNSYMRVDGFLYAGGGVNGVTVNAGNYVSGGILTAQGYATTQTTSLFKAVASQTANITEWQNSSGTVLAKVNATGALTSSGDMTITNGAVTLTVNQVVYSPGYSLMQFGSSIKATNYSTTSPTFLVQGPASQTANLQEWQDSTGSIQANVNNVGIFNSNNATGFQIAAATYYGTLNGGQTARVQAGGSVGANPHLVVRQSSGATGNLQEWQDSAGTVLAKVTQTGNGAFSYIAGTNGILQSLTGLLASTNITTRVNLTVQAIASQTANLQEWQQSDGTITSYIGNDGNVFIQNNRALFVNSGYIGSASFVTKAAGPTWNGIIVRGAASQTADLQQWQNSAGTVLAEVTASGGFELNGKDIELMNIMGAY